MVESAFARTQSFNPGSEVGLDGSSLDDSCYDHHWNLDGCGHAYEVKHILIIAWGVPQQRNALTIVSRRRRCGKVIWSE
jgi:hypothetical protein